MQPDADPIALIRSKAVAERSWRMQQMVRGYEEATSAMVSLMSIHQGPR